MKTLVYFGPSGIGDWMFILPSLQSLLHANGCDHAVVVLPRRNAANQILLRSPLITYIEYLDRPDHWRRLPAYVLRLLMLAWRLRRQRGRVAVVSYLSNQPDTLLLAWMSGISRRIGYRWQGTWLERVALNIPISPDGAKGKVALHARFAGNAGNTSPMPVSLLKTPSKEETRSIRQAHDLPENYVALGIGGGRNAHWRFWPAENFRALIKSMPDVHFVLLGGGADDRSAANSIMRKPLVNVSDLVGRITFDESLRVLECASACIGNDSGLANIAAAHGIPTLCIYGPTDYRLTGPALLGATPISIPVLCGPCFGEDQVAQTAIRCSDRVCLSGVDPKRVQSALRELLRTAQ